MFSVNGVTYQAFWQADCASQKLRNAGLPCEILRNGVPMTPAEVSAACFDLED